MILPQPVTGFYCKRGEAVVNFPPCLCPDGFCDIAISKDRCANVVQNFRIPQSHVIDCVALTTNDCDCTTYCKARGKK